MGPLNFESISGLAVTGNVNLIEGTSNLPVPSPNSIVHIRTDQDVMLHFSWTQTGWLSCLICGTWCIDVCFEECGEGEFSPKAASVNIATKYGNGQSYTASITFPANSIPKGFYKIIPCLTLKDQNGNCLLYTSPSPRDATLSRMPSSA